MRVRLNISMDVPEGATKEDCLRYAVAAVQSWKGQLRPAGGYGPDDPGDPMFYLDYESVVGSMAVFRDNQRVIVRCSSEN